MILTKSDGLLLGSGVIGDNVGILEGMVDGVNVGWRVGGLLGDLDGCVMYDKMADIQCELTVRTSYHIAGNIHMRLTSDVGFSVGELEGVRVGFFDG